MHVPGFEEEMDTNLCKKGLLYYLRMTNKHLQDCNPSKVVFITPFQELNDDRLRTSKRKPQRFYTLH